MSLIWVIKDEFSFLKRDFGSTIKEKWAIISDLKIFSFFTMFYILLGLMYFGSNKIWIFGENVVFVWSFFLILSLLSVLVIFLITLRSISKFWIEKSYIALFARISLHIILFILAFAFIYLFIDRIFPGSYLIKNKELISFLDYFYYSAVTFSTVWYGDIVPTTSIAKVVTLIDVVSGYIFMVLIIWNLTNITEHLEKSNREWYIEGFSKK